MATTSDYGLGPHTYPRGWFMIAPSEAVSTTQPLSLRFFGRELVLFRGQGKLVLLDAICPHMGTHIGKNSASYVVQDNTWIEGDSIRCPYHAWRFGPDGKCNHIPYHAGAIPEMARLRAWPVAERMGLVFMWHDPEGGAPDYDVPHLAEWDDPAWVRWELDDLATLPTHPVEVIDNMADVRHFDALHGSQIAYYRAEWDGHRYLQYMGGGHRTLTAGDALLDARTHYEGPGVLISRQNGTNHVIQFICHTPVEDGVIHIWHGLLYRGTGAVATSEDVAQARAFQVVQRTAFAQDFEIWANKDPAFQILMLQSDGPFHKGRIWYSQFYHPRSEAAALQARVNGRALCRSLPGSREEAEAGVAHSPELEAAR